MIRVLALPLWWLTIWLLVRFSPTAVRKPLAWILPALTIGWAAISSTPFERLVAGALWTLFSLKGSVLLNWSAQRVGAMSPVGLGLYLSFWPGMDATVLEKRDPEVSFPGQWFVRGWITMLVGVVGLLAMPVFGLSSTWLGVAGLLTAVHLGYSDILSALVRLAGFNVPRLFDQPLSSSGLRDFWSRRWNRPFVEMNRIIFLPLLGRFVSRKPAVVGAFIISGLFHEMAISLPVQAGWGGPMAYFVIQGLAMQLEGKFFKQSGGLTRRLWTWSWLFLPLPLLFHQPFREGFVAPLLSTIAAIPFLAGPKVCLSLLLWLAGWGHFLVLVASFQVPHRLGWFEELPRLRPFNRKIFWVYGGFIVGMITCLGALLLRLHPLIVARETGSLYLCGLVALFWTARLVVDSLVFEHSDWPEGPEMVIGHTLLTSLFVFLATTCWLNVLI